MKLIKLKCKHCKLIFLKQKKEVTRQRKKNKFGSFYCSGECSGHRNQKDKYSPFRMYLKSARKSAIAKKLKLNITVLFLKRLWESQNGRCWYSNIKLDLPISYRSKKFKPDSPSLDRIDSKKGYIRGNVRFICLSLNYAKNKFSESDFLYFLEQFKMQSATNKNKEQST